MIYFLLVQMSSGVKKLLLPAEMLLIDSSDVSVISEEPISNGQY